MTRPSAALRAGVGVVVAAVGLLVAARSHAADTVVFEVPDFRGLQLFLRDANGRNFGSLEAVRAAVEATGHRVVFAMNAGMYEPDRSPTGLFVQDGRQVAPLDVQSRPQDGRTPNFYLAPNGVLAVTAAGPAILSTAAFAKAPPPQLRLATQSGPLLLAGGAIAAPAVAAGTDAPTHRNKRNAVCVDGRRVRMVEVDAMTLHEGLFTLNARPRDSTKAVRQGAKRRRGGATASICNAAGRLLPRSPSGLRPCKAPGVVADSLRAPGTRLVVA